MNDDFYKVFEDRFRGSPAEIKDRLRFYLPYVSPVCSEPDRVCVDLGCGRGEWLELLQAASVSAFGVDADPAMVACCNTAGLNAQHGDIIDALKEMADGSIAVLTAFHVAEHLPFDVLRTLIAESFRVLRPNGLLILETPNPENFSMGAGKFYLDPTHKRPLHPLLLAFLVEHAGFERHMVAGLQEWPELHGTAPVGIYDVLWGSSADYAVIAQKSLSPATPMLDAVFAKSFGLSAEALAKRFDDQTRSLVSDIESMRDSFLAQITCLDGRLRVLEHNPLVRLGRKLQSLWQRLQNLVRR